MSNKLMEEMLAIVKSKGFNTENFQFGLALDAQELDTICRLIRQSQAAHDFQIGDQVLYTKLDDGHQLEVSTPLLNNTVHGLLRSDFKNLILGALFICRSGTFRHFHVHYVRLLHMQS